MDNKPKEEIAIAIFTGAIISLFILIGEFVENLYIRITIISTLIVFILASLKVILDKSTDFHSIGNIFRFLLHIKSKD